MTTQYFDAATYREAVAILEDILDLHDEESNLWHWFPQSNPEAVMVRTIATRLGTEAIFAQFEHESRYCHDCCEPLAAGVRFICTDCIEDRRRLQ